MLRQGSPLSGQLGLLSAHDRMNLPEEHCWKWQYDNRIHGETSCRHLAQRWSTAAAFWSSRGCKSLHSTICPPFALKTSHSRRKLPFTGSVTPTSSLGMRGTGNRKFIWSGLKKLHHKRKTRESERTNEVTWSTASQNC